MGGHRHLQQMNDEPVELLVVFQNMEELTNGALLW